jgi:hypothetical protein
LIRRSPQASAAAVPQASAGAFAVAVILSAANDPEEFNSPKTTNPSNPTRPCGLRDHPRASRSPVTVAPPTLA